MKDKVEKNEIILDTSGTECPIPVLKARNLCQTLSSGAIVKVICTDPLAEEDFRHYCKQSNYSLIDIIKSESSILKVRVFEPMNTIVVNILANLSHINEMGWTYLRAIFLLKHIYIPQR